jgi:hypothetical protein
MLIMIVIMVMMRIYNNNNVNTFIIISLFLYWWITSTFYNIYNDGDDDVYDIFNDLRGCVFCELRSKN